MKKKKIAPQGLNQKIFDTLKRKEQDFVLMLFSRKYTRQEIMDKFYIESRQGYYKLNKTIREKIAKWQLSWQWVLQR